MRPVEPPLAPWNNLLLPAGSGRHENPLTYQIYSLLVSSIAGTVSCEHTGRMPSMSIASAKQVFALPRDGKFLPVEFDSFDSEHLA